MMGKPAYSYKHGSIFNSQAKNIKQRPLWIHLGPFWPQQNHHSKHGNYIAPSFASGTNTLLNSWADWWRSIPPVTAPQKWAQQEKSQRHPSASHLDRRRSTLHTRSFFFCPPPNWRLCKITLLLLYFWASFMSSMKFLPTCSHCSSANVSGNILHVETLSPPTPNLFRSGNTWVPHLCCPLLPYQSVHSFHPLISDVCSYLWWYRDLIDTASTRGNMTQPCGEKSHMGAHHEGRDQSSQVIGGQNS